MHTYYVNQALKPRGQSTFEKVQFLSTWYTNSANKVEPSDNHQREFLNIMGEWGSILSNLDENELDKKLNDAMTLAQHSLDNAQTTAEKAFYSYLILELQRCL